MFDVQTISVLTLPSVPFADRKGLPARPAIYFVLNAHGTVLYVGRSVNLAGRWGGGSQHHQTTTLTQHGATHLTWLVMDDAALLASVEAARRQHVCRVVSRPLPAAWSRHPRRRQAHARCVARDEQPLVPPRAPRSSIT